VNSDQLCTRQLVIAVKVISTSLMEKGRKNKILNLCCKDCAKIYENTVEAMSVYKSMSMDTIFNF
jgi:hypothetical protein